MGIERGEREEGEKGEKRKEDVYVHKPTSQKECLHCEKIEL